MATERQVRLQGDLDHGDELEPSLMEALQGATQTVAVQLERVGSIW